MYKVLLGLGRGGAISCLANLRGQKLRQGRYQSSPSIYTCSSDWVLSSTLPDTGSYWLRLIKSNARFPPCSRQNGHFTSGISDVVQFRARTYCIENLTIVVTHLVYRLALQFLTACFAKFPRISLPHFRFKLLQTSRQRKPEVALKFRVWLAGSKTFRGLFSHQHFTASSDLIGLLRYLGVLLLVRFWLHNLH